MTAKHGDTVTVHYKGSLEDGTIFDDSTNRSPLQFTIGDGQIIPGFERAVIGMGAGESKTCTVPATEAYGPHREEMVFEAERKRLSADLTLEVGGVLQIRHENGHVTEVVVTDLSESKVTLDANHLLAGKDLIFHIQLLEIN